MEGLTQMKDSGRPVEFVRGGMQMKGVFVGWGYYIDEDRGRDGYPELLAVIEMTNGHITVLNPTRTTINFADRKKGQT